MATTEWVIGSGDEDCSGRSGGAIVFAWIVRFAEGGSRVSISSLKPGIWLPSSSAVAPRSGAEVVPREAPGETVATIIKR